MQRQLRFAVLGDPIEHSRSPAIHSAALAHLGLEGSYVAIRADTAELRASADRLRDGSLDGLNITMPLKEEAAAISDRLTPEARTSGSVNTMRARDGALEGHSSDVIAARHALGDPRFDDAAPVLVLGAGGAAAALLVAAQGRQVYLAARNQEKGRALSERVGAEAAMVPFGTGAAGALVFNATPLGMAGERLPDQVTALASGIVDLAYGADETPAVVEARQRGVPVMEGLEFLVLQAAASFEWWTGRAAPFEVMLSAAKNA
jgi:shikimate dehydrogenase